MPRWARLAAICITLGCRQMTPGPTMGGVVERHACPAAPVDTLTSERVYAACQVQAEPALIGSHGRIGYPDILRQAVLTGDVVGTLVVDSAGRARMASVKLEQGNHDLFVTAIRNGLPSLRWTPAQRGGRPVAAEVTLFVRFRLMRDTVSACSPMSARADTIVVCMPFPKVRRCYSHGGCEEVVDTFTVAVGGQQAHAGGGPRPRAAEGRRLTAVAADAAHF